MISFNPKFKIGDKVKWLNKYSFEGRLIRDSTGLAQEDERMRKGVINNVFYNQAEDLIMYELKEQQLQKIERLSKKIKNKTESIDLGIILFGENAKKAIPGDFVEIIDIAKEALYELDYEYTFVPIEKAKMF